MIKRKIGSSKIEVSAVGLGTWAIGGGEWWGESDEQQSIETAASADIILSEPELSRMRCDVLSLGMPE